MLEGCRRAAPAWMEIMVMSLVLVLAGFETGDKVYVEGIVRQALGLDRSDAVFPLVVRGPERREEVRPRWREAWRPPCSRHDGDPYRSIRR